MARLRQQHPSNYRSSGTISDEFEQIVRYLNSAERGNKTLGELIAQLFDDAGNFAGPVAFRLDAVNGFQVRIGTYADPQAGWQTLAGIADLRGPSGIDVGLIEGPLFFNRREYVVSNAPMGTTQLPYDFSPISSTVVIYRNGLLLQENTYVPDVPNNQVFFTDPLLNNDRVTIYSVRADQSSGYRREDMRATQNQAVFPLPNEESQRFLIFRDGVLQRDGAAYDYVLSPAADTLTFMSPLDDGDMVTALRVEDTALTRVAGLLMEEDWVVNGYIPWSKLSVPNGAIGAEKVFGLGNVVSDAALISIGPTAPTGPNSRKLWIDTTEVPNVLRFFDGVQWLRASAITALPEFTTANANQIVKLNGTGTALVYADPDYSTLILKEKMGVADGVATLDTNGKVPVGQLPAVSKGVFWHRIAGAVANGSFLIQRVFNMRVRIEAMTYRVGTGQCDVSLQINGTTQGATYTAGVSVGAVKFPSQIELDATQASLTVGYAVANQASATDLEIGITYSVLP